MYEGFDRRTVGVTGADITVRTAGSGPAVLLLHGYPQDSSVWHRVATDLARDHTVVTTDLRGYGTSSVPPPGNDHSAYSFRTMGNDQVEVMAALGHEQYAVVGHDRGARVGHRMALDHPEAISRLVVMDIVPTRHVLENVDAALASKYYHWFFLIQPNLPEHLIGLDPLYYLHASLGSLGSGLDIHAPDALASYERAFADPQRRLAMLADYRAAPTVDLQHDRLDADRRLTMPVLVLWGSKGVVGELYDPVEVWGTYADDVRGHPVDAGHFLVDERPDDVVGSLRGFLP